MKITLTRSVGGAKAGDTIDRSAKVARHLIEAGAATEAASEPDKSDTKPKQNRRSQSRKAKDGDATGDRVEEAADKPAGQEGGGVPLSTPATTAG